MRQTDNHVKSDFKFTIFCTHMAQFGVMRMRKHMWKFDGVFNYLCLPVFLLALLLSINANVEQWSNHGLF